MMKRLAIAALALGCAACGGGTDAPPDDLVGTYGAGPLWGYGAGVGYLELAPDGSGSVRGEAFEEPDDAGITMSRLLENEFTYATDGGLLTVAGDWTDCESGSTGTYAWQVEYERLEMLPVDEPCQVRRDLMDPYGAWQPLEDAPIIAAEPTVEPITVATPIGPITWQVVPGQHADPVVFDGGFVAVIEDDDEEPQLMTSRDGIAWQRIDDPPATALLAARGTELYVADLLATDVYVSTDLGASWTALSIESPEFATGLVAGPAGVLLMQGGSAQWVLADDAFQRVKLSAPVGEILPLDSGFFAGPSNPDRNATYWHSSDGRRWDQVTTVPVRLSIQASHGDSVYGADNWTWDSFRGYTSDDGGLTWGWPLPRPGHALAVNAAGYVAVDYGGVAWASADGEDWERVLNPWPMGDGGQLVMSDNTILISGETCDEDQAQCQSLDWVGTIG